MTTDEYNGWTNRETWALNLWLSNDQGLYEMTRERVAQALDARMRSDASDKWATTTEAWQANRQRVAGRAVNDLYFDLTDGSQFDGESVPQEVYSMVREVGSVRRVNWDEIGAAWLEDLDG